MARLRHSLLAKLLWGVLVPALVLAFVGVGYFWRRTEADIRTSTQEQALAVADLLSTTFEFEAKSSKPGRDESPHRAVTDAVRAEWRLLKNVSELRIINGAGMVRWSRQKEEEGRPLPHAEPLLAVNAPPLSLEGKTARVIRPVGGMACAGCHPDNPMRVGVLELRARQPELVERVSGAFRWAVTALSVLGVFLVLGAALALHLFLARPLQKLAGVMKRAEEGEFLVRAEAKSKDEIGELTLAFNRMMAKITSLKAEEIDTQRDLEEVQQKLLMQETIERRANQLQLLYDVARSLNSTLELPELLGRISALIADRLKVPQFSVMLSLPDGEFEVKAAHPASQATLGMRFRGDEGVCGKAAQTRAAVYVADVSKASGEFVTRSEDVQRSIGSLLAIPMVHKGEVLGVLNFEHPAPNGFPDESVELLGAVADLAATAVKNTVLHEETVALSVTDPLTGAFNRRHMFSRLEMEVARALRYGGQVSVVMVDIDHFKQLNDLQGHRAGDKVLRKVSDLLRGSLRKLDTLARYGGEEFLVILPQASKQEALEVADKLRRVIADTVFPEGSTQPLGKITISVGMASLPTDARELEVLVDRADSALYASKRAGRNAATGYTPGMELHPTRERGPHAQKRTKSGEQPKASEAS